MALGEAKYIFKRKDKGFANFDFDSTILNANFLNVRLDKDNRAVYTREHKPRLTLAAAYIRRERKHLYEYGLY